jgi:hypothetical protein
MNYINEITKADLINGSCVIFESHRYKDNEIHLNKRRIEHKHNEGLYDISSILTIVNEILKKRRYQVLSSGLFQ